MVVTLLASWDLVYLGATELTDLRAATGCGDEFEGTPFSEHNCTCFPPTALRCVVRFGAASFQEFPTTGKVYEKITTL